ncbi:hypothetical protein BBK82_04740 [Lentzea guizhouensis]|uniref:Uncharacterized protein n=1 Tax=Lentzea guizhouensis TaxID=1586287 RepID=A0A1B2HCQ7_9PSEU|nr:hypothetical protein [Lentzea guizhouensis]ANZ35489.1 hypothetical protein BBK82_04740 [Lentzea guizhouensis]
MNGRASGRGRVYQAYGDQHFNGVHEHKHDHDDNDFNGLFLGRGPGRLVIVVGMAVAAFGFVGWASIIFGSWHRKGPSDGESMLGDVLPSGLPIGVVYFIGFGLGAVLVQIGSSMAKAAARNGGFLGHLVVAVVLLAIVGVAAATVLAGAGWDAVAPDFTR